MHFEETWLAVKEKNNRKKTTRLEEFKD